MMGPNTSTITQQHQDTPDDTPQTTTGATNTN